MPCFSSRSFSFHGKIEPEFFQIIFDNLLVLCRGVEFSSFGISFKLPKPCAFEKEAKQLQTQLIKEFEKETKAKLDFIAPEISFLVDFEWNRIECSVLPIYISGRYNKFSRELPQTLHYCFQCKGAGCMQCEFTGKASKESIQELLEEVFFHAFQATESKFHGAGREDKNVRMLGNGREFVLELLNAKKRKIGLAQIESRINSALSEKIAVHDLKLCGKETIAKIKVESHDKIYSAMVSCNSVFDAKKLQNLLGEKLAVSQHTPSRSEKSRSDLERKHSTVLQKFSRLNEKEFQLELACSHGMYVKEFISGDGERTSPSLSELLGVNCLCTQLDVLLIL